MGIEEMKNQAFSDFSFEEWKKMAEESLKGKPLETLQKTTYEKIILKPLYHQEDLPNILDLPGNGDFRRGMQPFGYKEQKWEIAQKLEAETPEILKEKLRSAFKRGQTAISFKHSNKLMENPVQLAEVLSEFTPQYSFAVELQTHQQEFLNALRKNRLKITGYIASDPMALFPVSGLMPSNPTIFFRKWAGDVKQMSGDFPNLKTLLINTSVYHNGGANAVQELGIAAAVGVFYLQTLLENGIELKKALSSIVFQFSIGASFFTEIAKLRAARIIWSKIAEIFGAEPADRGMVIAAETSVFTKTIYDQHVNLLRAGNEAFAAVLGGIHYLHVSPFDDVTAASAFSERIACNTQLILQEEMNLRNVADPAGGSWCVESLTNELAEKAWSFFQQIEARGGILEGLKTNWLQKEISFIQEKRTQDIFSRKTSIIGTNVYANLADKASVNEQSVSPPFTFETETTETVSIQRIPQARLSLSFEKLRGRAEGMKQKPSVGLIGLGSFKQHKVRVDFVKGFLAAGGIRAVVSEPTHTEDEALAFVATAETNHFCLCGSDDLYETLGFDLLKAVKDKYPKAIFYMAGLPEKENQLLWQQNGISKFVHVKSNCYETLSAILEEMEAALNEQAKA